MRFDKEYSYGDEHDAWKEYAKTVGESAADLLSCDVGVSGMSLHSTRSWGGCTMISWCVRGGGRVWRPGQ